MDEAFASASHQAALKAAECPMEAEQNLQRGGEPALVPEPPPQGSGEPQQEEGAAAAGGAGASVQQGREALVGNIPPPAYVLLGERHGKLKSESGETETHSCSCAAVDGTWHEGREMFKALQPVLLAPQGPGVQVQLPRVESQDRQLLRKEPEV